MKIKSVLCTLHWHKQDILQKATPINQYQQNIPIGRGTPDPYMHIERKRQTRNIHLFLL